MAQYLTPDMLNLAPNSTYRLMAQQSAAMNPQQGGVTGDWSEASAPVTAPVDPYLALKNNLPSLQNLNPQTDLKDSLLSEYRANVAAQQKLRAGSRAQQQQGLQDLEGRIGQIEAPRSVLQGVNLAPLLSFADSLTGANTMRGYAVPKTNEDRMKEAIDLRQNLQAQKNQLAENDIAALRAQMQDKLAMDQLAQQKKGLSKASDDLRSEWLKNKTTMNTQVVATSFDKVRTAASDPSPAGDMSLIFGYMKMLDPESTVREGEYASAEKARAVPASVLNIYNKILTGQKLTPEQRIDFVNQAQKQFDAQMLQQQRLNDTYLNLATQTGANPEHVVLKDLFKGVTAQQQPAKNAPPGWKIVGDEWVQE